MNFRRKHDGFSRFEGYDSERVVETVEVKEGNREPFFWMAPEDPRSIEHP